MTRIRQFRRAALFLAALGSLGGARARAGPELSAVLPAGVQRGTTAPLVLHGARLDAPQAIHFYRPGITVASLSAEGGGLVRAECTIAPDMPPGEVPLRLRTATGLTDIRTIYIGALPVVAETEPNGDFAVPQAVALNSTVAGVIAYEDVDYFAVQAAAGQRISVEIEAMRLGRAMFDPYVAILDTRRFELAACDDSALLLQDATASIIAPADGTYVIQVREASFGGGDGFCYRLHVGDFPRPMAVFPAGARQGETATLTLAGDVLGAAPMALNVPADASELYPVFFADARGAAPSANRLWVSPLNAIVEPSALSAASTGAPATPTTSPADETAATATAPPAPPPMPPVAFDGVLDAPGQVDAFAFAVVAKTAYEVRMVSRRLRSPLDGVVEIVDAAGAVIAGNDDGEGPDPALRFTAAADGVLTLRVRDHRGRGGAHFVYRVEIAPPAASLAVSLERADSRRPQFLQAVAVPRGNRMAALFRADRRNGDGPVQIDVEGLPAGLALQRGTLAAGHALLPAVFEAAADAPTAGGLCRVAARMESGGTTVAGRFEQLVPLVIGPPNESIYYQTSVDRLAIAVTEPAPISVQVTSPPGGLLRSGAASLRVRVERAAGFDGEVTLFMLWNPPGLSSAGSVVVAPNAVEAAFPVNAAGDAMLATHDIAVLARAAVAGDERWISSALTPLSVGDVYLTGRMEPAAVERGKAGAILVRAEHRRPLEAAARATLHGLPPGVTAPEIEVSGGQAELVFSIACGAESPVGQHGGLFCTLTTTAGGGECSHRFAEGGTIRIDPPPPQPVAAAPAPAAPEPAAPPAPRPLSRLEQLRHQARQRTAAENGQAAADASNAQSSGGRP